MLISDAATRAMNEVSARERDVLQVFAPAPPAPEKTIISADAPPGAYFITAGERGRLLFSQDGAFTVRDGTLTDASGRAVLGYRDAASPLEPLRIDPIDVALGVQHGARLEADGSFVCDRVTVEPRTGRIEMQPVVFGRLALARFAPATKLQAIDAQHVGVPPGVAPHIGLAGDGNFAPLQVFGTVQRLDRQLQRMQEAYLALDAVRAATLAQSGVEKTAMDLLK